LQRALWGWFNTFVRIVAVEVEPSKHCQGLPMKPHFMVFTLIACGAVFSAVAERAKHGVQPESQASVIQLDLVALQQQADTALANLRQTQRSRQVPVAALNRHYSLLISAR